MKKWFVFCLILAMLCTQVPTAFAARGVYRTEGLHFTEVFADDFEAAGVNTVYKTWSGVFGVYPEPVEGGRLVSSWNPPDGIGFAFKKSYMNVRYSFDVAIEPGKQNVLVLRCDDLGALGNYFGSFDSESTNGSSAIALLLSHPKYPGQIAVCVASVEGDPLNDTVLYTMPYPSDVDFAAGARMDIYDLDDKLLVFINDEPFAAFTFEDLADNTYRKGTLYDELGDSVATFEKQVLRTSNFGFVNRTSKVYLDNFSVATLDGAQTEFVKEPYVMPDLANIRDNYADTWVATDDLGRTTPTSEEAGLPRDKKVGMFYFVHKANSNANYDDVYATYLAGGVDAVWNMVRNYKGGRMMWGEPYFGYYRTDDTWVIRKHAAMLVNAGVDFLFFDCSNNSLHLDGVLPLLDTFAQMRREGLQTPQFAFFLGDRAEFFNNLVETLYEEIYEPGYYEDLWFLWEGKPLLLGNPATYLGKEEVVDAFTLRRSWAFEGGEAYQETQGKGTWLWADVYPQAPGYSPDGRLEQMIVMAGFWANGNGGRSNVSTNPTQSTQKIPANVPLVNDFEFSLVDNGTSGKGLAYQEHWDYAQKIDPPLIMITGWNEWNVTNSIGLGQGQTIANTFLVNTQDPLYNYCFVDCFNPEFSRDTEPMRGGYGDNYYYQTVNNIRLYKGVRPIPYNVTEGTVSGFDGWEQVSPAYYDSTGDTTHRSAARHVGSGSYQNTTGRNNFDYVKVSVGTEQILLYAVCREDIVSDDGENWMNVFIDIDQSAATGWHGYDYVLNRSRTSDEVSVEQCVENSWKWEQIGTAAYAVQGNRMVITVPAALLPGAETGFDFKWADNSTVSGEIMEFMDLGDTAPDDRFNYRVRFNTTGLSAKTADLLAQGTVAMAIGKAGAFSGTEKTMIDPENDRVVPVIVNDRTLVPVRFISENFAADVAWDGKTQTVSITYGTKTVRLYIGEAVVEIDGALADIDAAPQIINDRTFVPLRVIAEALDKTVFWDPRGLILIGSEAVTAPDSAIPDEILGAL